MDSETIVIVDGARTPVGSFGGALKDVPAHELGATAVRAAIERAGSVRTTSQEVVMGCIGQVGTDAYNARRVAIGSRAASAAPALHGEPAVRLGPSSRLVGRDGDAVERARPHGRRGRRVDEPDAVLRLRRAQRLPAGRPSPRRTAR